MLACQFGSILVRLFEFPFKMFDEPSKLMTSVIVRLGADGGDIAIHYR